MNHSMMTAALVGSMMVTAASGAVTQIDPGQAVALEGITHAQDPTLGGGVLEDWAQSFVISNDAGELYRATLQSRVTQRFDTGELDFYWRIRDIELSSVGVASIVVSGLQGWDVGVEWRIDGSGDAGASDAYRSADGDAIGYLFAAQPLSGNTESKFMLGRTGAFEYDQTGTVRINLVSGEFVEFATFAPTVPAPGAGVLLGLGGLVAGRRRRGS